MIIRSKSAWVTAIQHPASIVGPLVSSATLKFTFEVYSLTIIGRFHFADLDLIDCCINDTLLDMRLFELTRKKGA